MIQGPGAKAASGYQAGRATDARPLFVAALCALLLTSCVYWTPRSRRPTASAVTIENVPAQKWDIRSCGAGALSSVLQHHGDTTTMAEWDAKLPKTRGGVMSIDLVLAARERGFDASLVTGDANTLDAELREGRPAILMLQVVSAPGKSYDFFHYVVIDGRDATRNLYRTQFGDGKSRWVALDRLEPAWKPTKHAMIVIRRADPNAKLLRAAVQLEEQGNFALAAQTYREILRNDPRSVVAWTNLGNAEARLQRTAAAEEAFRKAIEIDPLAADALNNLAWLFFEAKRTDEAEPIARRAVAVEAPDSWTRLDTLARILAARGNCAEATATFRKALDQLPATRNAERAGIEDASRTLCPAVAAK